MLDFFLVGKGNQDVRKGGCNVAHHYPYEKQGDDAFHPGCHKDDDGHDAAGADEGGQDRHVWAYARKSEAER